MKEIKLDFELLYDFENLLRAHKLARRGKTKKKDVMAFEQNLNQNLITLQKQLQSKTYVIGQYRQFYIFLPKKRLIMALPFRDRIVQHALCMQILPIIEKHCISANAANRKNKGVHYALDLYEKQEKRHQINYGMNGYVLKADIKGFFYNINRDILKQRVRKIIWQEDFLWLIDLIIDSSPDLELNGVNKGLPIGNLTSQFLAIYYLSSLDHYIKEELRIKNYVRYMDDFTLIHYDREYLKYCLERIGDFLKNELDLELNQKTQITPLYRGADFLGFHNYISQKGEMFRLIRKDSIRRAKSNIKKVVIQYHRHQIDQKQVKQVISSWLGHAKHGDTHNLRRKILKTVNLSRSRYPSKIVTISEGGKKIIWRLIDNDRRDKNSSENWGEVIIKRQEKTIKK